MSDKKRAEDLALLASLPPISLSQAAQARPGRGLYKAGVSTLEARAGDPAPEGQQRQGHQTRPEEQNQRIDQARPGAHRA